MALANSRLATADSSNCLCDRDARPPLKPCSIGLRSQGREPYKKPVDRGRDSKLMSITMEDIDGA